MLLHGKQEVNTGYPYILTTFRQPIITTLEMSYKENNIYTISGQNLGLSLGNIPVVGTTWICRVTPSMLKSVSVELRIYQYGYTNDPLEHSCMPSYR